MSVYDISEYKNPFPQMSGSLSYNVAAGATTINPNEPIARALGATTCTALATNKPVVGTDYILGISTSTSTQTASVAGKVQYTPLLPGQVWIISVKVATDINTQAKYDALVGKRVLIDLTSGTYTLLSADGATYGCVIMPMNITENPNKIAFSFRNTCIDLGA
jgi:hypothetical protein